MFKKLVLFTSLLLGLPLAMPLVEAAKNTASVMALKAEEEEKGEYKGYTYTQKGTYRYYDTTELTPKIVKNYWAPSGYKFTLNFSDDQINDILDQTDSLGNHYSYVSFNLSYNKFGMNIDIEQFSNGFENRQECFDYIKNEINNYSSFYELENITADTELSVDLNVFFSGALSGYTFYFKGEEETISPIDQTAFIVSKVTYDDGVLEYEPTIRISGYPMSGFFNEDPLRNEYGYETDEYTDKYVYDEEEEQYVYYDHCAVYTMKLYAYESVEIADASYGFVTVTYPSHPLPVKLKMEFDSHGQHYSVWSKEFTIGDPGFHVSIDGFDDRESVQVGTEHEYSLDFDSHSDEELKSLIVKTTLKPVRLSHSENLVEYYDLAVEPVAASDIYLVSNITGFYENNSRYSFSQIDDSHYVLRNVPLQIYDEVFIRNAKTSATYHNHSEYDGCHYHIEWGDSVYMDDEGIYDIYLDLNTTTDNYFSFQYIGPINVAANYFLKINDQEPIKLLREDLSNFEHYALGVNLNEGDIVKVIDDKGNVTTNQSEWECCGFTINKDGQMVVSKTGKYDVNFYVYSSRGMNIVLKSKPLPSVGQEGLIYYIASPNEVRLHHEGKDEEFLNTPHEGQYVYYDAKEEQFKNFNGVDLIDFDSEKYLGDSDLMSLAKGKASIFFTGEWIMSVAVHAVSENYEFGCMKDGQRLEVSTRDKSGDYIVLKSSLSNEELPDEVNLLNGAEKIEIIPHIPSYQQGIKYYHSHEVEKDGIVQVEEKENGALLLTTLNPGITTITFEVECELFPTLTKTISVRVLDAIYDVAKIAVPNEFHFAGKELTASLSIRGFSKIQNIDVTWDITNKKGEKIDEKKINVKHDATVTLLETESEDYTFVAYYEGVKLDSLTVQVRLIDLNSFLRANVWWIFLITIIFLAFIIFLNRIVSRGRTTVQHIERAYQVFCKSVSDDKLTLGELKTIRRAITKCMHSCEDLNIEALNQYEKAIRYLRKSISDCTSLIKKWDSITLEDKSVFIEKLNADLNKALNVAREIENAKEISEQYHEKANRQNYEKIVDDKTNTKDTKKK